MSATSDYAFDFHETVSRILKYLLEGLIVSTVAFAMPGKKLEVMEVVMLGIVAAAAFALLDMFSPSVGVSIRQGAGLGMGAQLVGFQAGPTAKYMK